MSAPVKITLAEPSVIIRNGMLSILRRLSTLHVEVFEVSDMEQLKNSLGWQKPDVLMVNPSFLDGFSLQQIKKEANSDQLRCIALQSALADSSTLKAYDEVVSIYDSADQIKEKLTKIIHEPEEDRRHESLSGREKEVIVCVIKGMTNKQIADELRLSTHTVITHRRNISAKLQIHSTAGLTIYAIVNKLVELDEVKNFVADVDN
ncbi:MAG: LuxR C-terminal-related transcriptional regulator [Prevotellaceae bacterium]|jgi:DNA-binding NarL/FixJ family response regulator|nr:LuxR C-terminal-related transcriptional regulator [Prevotellaceae bacterium]